MSLSGNLKSKSESGIELKPLKMFTLRQELEKLLADCRYVISLFQMDSLLGSVGKLSLPPAKTLFCDQPYSEKMQKIYNDWISPGADFSVTHLLEQFDASNAADEKQNLNEASSLKDPKVVGIEKLEHAILVLGILKRFFLTSVICKEFLFCYVQSRFLLLAAHENDEIFSQDRVLRLVLEADTGDYKAEFFKALLKTAFQQNFFHSAAKMLDIGLENILISTDHFREILETIDHDNGLNRQQVIVERMLQLSEKFTQSDLEFLFMLAVGAGAKNTVLSIIDSKWININFQYQASKVFTTALLQAVEHREIDLVEALLLRGADKTIKNEKYFTALDIEKRNNKKFKRVNPYLEGLLEQEYSSISEYINKFAALRAEYMESISLRLSAQLEHDKIEKMVTANLNQWIQAEVRKAISTAFPNIKLKLAQAGFNLVPHVPEAKNEPGYSPLMLAVTRGNFEVAHSLLERSVNPETSGENAHEEQKIALQCAKRKFCETQMQNTKREYLKLILLLEWCQTIYPRPVSKDLFQQLQGLSTRIIKSFFDCDCLVSFHNNVENSGLNVVRSPVPDEKYPGVNVRQSEADIYQPNDTISHQVYIAQGSTIIAGTSATPGALSRVVSAEPTVGLGAPSLPGLQSPP